MSNYIPDTWSLTRTKDSKSFLISSNSETVCVVDNDLRDGGRDARLIAFAPGMYNQLAHIKRGMEFKGFESLLPADYWDKVYKQISELLNLIDGETSPTRPAE